MFTHNDIVCKHKKEACRGKSAPSKSAEKESSSNAGDGKTSHKKRRADEKDENVAQNGRLPRGRR